MFRSVRKTLKPRRAGERPGRSTRLSNDPPRPRRVCNKGGKCLEIIGIYKNFTEITNNELSCGEQKALSDVSPMFSRLHFVLNLLVRVLSRNLLSRGASAGDVSRSPANISGPSGAVLDSTLQSLSPSSIVDSSLANMFGLAAREARIEAKQSAEKKNFLPRRMRQQKLLLLLFISLSLFRFFHGLFTRTNGARRRREGRNGTGNSSKQQEQQRTINKMPIDDEARLSHASILTSEPENFLASARFSANENISIELVQWNRRSTKRAAQKEARNDDRAKAQKLVSMFLRPQHTQAAMAGTQPHFCAKVHAACLPYLPGRTQSWTSNILHRHHHRFLCPLSVQSLFVNLHSPKSFISNGAFGDRETKHMSR